MSLREVRKNDRQRVKFGFSITSYWMKIGPSFLKPIVWRSKCKPTYYYDMHLLKTPPCISERHYILCRIKVFPH